MRSGISMRGFTLLEVLIALLVLSFGLLGLAALQAYAVKANQSANFRSQATSLANMMLDNIRANRVNLGDYYSDDYDDTACTSTPPTSSPAAFELAEWQRTIRCQLPNGRGAVAPISANEVAVCIRWADSRWDSDSGDSTGKCTVDASTFKAGLADNGPGAGTDGQVSVFVVSSRM
ncbi:MAG TPA: type IV pilus modification protein PilV [Dokdonella sp.]|uniref:type IV pilus modification protein PilV n=1 Tax=Dokdonella sp. TaxID=2291710 RepID=UPI002D7EC926|nr:type IV pilus modification protein PilV [Dokdonella sp.]HET9034244.1 type IV pilus modification protein PilV [Dokdonella sp.]